MKKSVTAAAVLAIVSAACWAVAAESPEAVVQSTTAAIKDLTAALVKIKDEASAKKEATNVNTMGENLQQEYIAYGEVAEGAPDGSVKPETKKAMDEAETKLDTEIKRVTGDVKLAAAMGVPAENIKTFMK